MARRGIGSRGYGLGSGERSPSRRRSQILVGSDRSLVRAVLAWSKPGRAAWLRFNRRRWNSHILLRPAEVVGGSGSVFGGGRGAATVGGENWSISARRSFRRGPTCSINIQHDVRAGWRRSTTAGDWYKRVCCAQGNGGWRRQETGNRRGCCLRGGDSCGVFLGRCAVAAACAFVSAGV